MSRIDPIQEAFTSGEISPRLWGRASLDLYKAGLGKCENFLVYPHGGVTKRGGFHYVAEVKDSTKTTILQKFNYKDEYQYVFEFGDNYIRVFRNQVAVMDGGSPYEIVTTYTESEVQYLRFTQDEEKLFIVHKDHPPAELIRTDHNDWTLQNVNFSNQGVLTLDNVVEPERHVWTTRTPAFANLWTAVCWSPELELFCAVSRSGVYNRVMTSHDGVTWTYRVPATNYNWTAICWSPELSLFVAVANTSGTTDRAMTSPDGIAWTLQVTPYGMNWQSVCWSSDLGLFCVVASSGVGYRVLLSSDGITWSYYDSGKNYDWTSICWSSELSLFVAVSESGVGNRVMTSPNGTVWTQRTSAADNDWQSVCWSSELSLFVAVSESGVGNRVMTSSDGIVWTIRTSAADNDWQSVCWSSELSLFVAVSESGTDDRVMTSPEGIVWTIRTSAADNTWQSVCWSPELMLFCAVSESGKDNRVMTGYMGLKNDTYTEVKLITDEEDEGSGAEATVIITDNVIDTIIVTEHGATYEINDVLTIEPTDIGGSDNAVDYDEDEDEDNENLITCDVATLTENDLPDEWGPGVATVDTIVDQSDHDNGTYEDVELSGGSGSGVRATVLIESNSVSSITITEAGSLYVIDDTLTIPIEVIGGTAPVTCDVAALTIENYPSLAWFFEQRFWLSATPNEPNQVWSSRSADYFNFYLGEGLDDEGIAVTIKGANKILWATDGSTAIIIGAHNGEFKLASNSLNEALTPSNIRPVQITNYGNAFVPIAQIGADILFVQKGLRIVRRLRYEYTTNSYNASPISIISEHITESGVAGVAYMNEPSSIFWAFRTDGVLIAMTYEPDSKVFGWHRHPIGGKNSSVKSIASIDGTSDVAKDELWAVIERTINGSTVKYIEFLVPEGLSLEDNQEDAFFVDSGITKTGSGFTIFDGLGHLEGEEVRILADGAVQAPKSVLSGEITLDVAANKAHAGLAYDASIETLPLEGGNPIGTAQAKIKRVSSFVLRLYRSLTFYAGDVFGNEDVYPFGPPEEMGSATPLFTGDTVEQAFPSGYDTQGRIRIASYDPLPITILAIMYELRVKD